MLIALIRHELRLAWRGRSRSVAAATVVGLLLGLYLLVGIAIGYAMRDTPIAPSAAHGALVFGGALLIASFMTTQAMLASQQTLYETRDLELLLTAPLPPRIVVLAKLLGIGASVATTYAALILPILLPIALFGHPQLLGGVVLILVLSASGAAIGLALTLILARLAGPRAARTVGQIAAAVLGGAFFLATQLVSHARDGTSRSLIGWFEAQGLGVAGWSALPLRAAFGDPVALALLTGIGIVLFVGVGVVLERQFLATYRDGGMRLSHVARRRRGSAGLFHASLRHTIFAKEWRLLLRDPALIAQILMRLVYLLPLVFVGFRQGAAATPMLALAGVLIASQLAGSLTWLAVAAEDAPELLQVAPIDLAEAQRAKLAAALAMTAPFALLPALVVASTTLVGALVMMLLAALASVATGYVEMVMAKPGRRSDFARRQKGSLAASLLTLLIALICGGIAAVAVYLLAR